MCINQIRQKKNFFGSRNPTDPPKYKIQDGGRRHLGFRKAAAISLLFD